MNSTSPSSSGWRYGVLWFLAGAITVFILIEHARLVSEVAVLRADRQRLAGEQQQTQARLERIEARLTEWESRGPRMDARFSRMDRPPEGPGAGGPDNPTPPNFRNRLLNIVNRGPSPGAPPPPPAGTRRPWGPEQAVGPPDTLTAGDQSTAWASREQDAGPEWIRLEFPEAVETAQVRIRETYNPGAISKVVGIVGNREQVLWEGIEEAAPAPREFSVPVAGNLVLRSIIVHLDTSRVPGWNEIDAVELIAKDGRRQWAQSATASSTYAERMQPPVEAFDSVQPIPAPPGPRGNR